MLLRPVLMPILRNPLQGIADGIRNMLAELLGSSQFFAPLTHSLVLARGTGSPTFTRVDPTPRATFRDWEGVLKTAPSGCARFEGARMVRNLLTFTEDFSNAAWLKANITVAANSTTTPDGTTTATKLTATASAATYVIGVHNSFAGTAAVFSLYVKKSSGATDLNQFAIYNATTATTLQSCTINFDTGVVTQVTGSGSSVSDEGDGWYRLQMVATSGITSGNNLSLYIGALGGAQSANEAIFVWHPQLEDVTGQADQTASEYVSVGVESAPYHGAGVDGVEFFNTDRDGAVIPTATNTGYLAEGARTNLCLQSEDFTTTWAAGAATVNANQSTAPNGKLTMDGFAPSAGVGSHFIYQDIAKASSALTYTYSLWVKRNPGQTDNIVLSASDGVAAGWACVFDPDTGDVLSNFQTVGAGFTFVDAQLVESENGAYRFALTITTTATPTIEVVVWSTNTTNSIASYAGNGVDQFYMWGAQLELGSFASSYIATTTAAVTRAADVDSVPTASNILAAASTVCLEFTPDHTPSGTIALWGTYVDASNYTAILHDATNMIMRKRIAGVNYDATIANAFSANTTYKVCGSWGASGATVTVDGTEGTPHANTTAAQIAATMQWGADGNSLQQPFATERNARVWQRQLSASERGAVTS